MRLCAPAWVLYLILAAAAAAAAAPGREITVASKSFTESVILAGIVVQLLTDRGHEVTHRRELGGTRILWDGLLSGEIDIYPEYTGTLRNELLSREALPDDDALRKHLGTLGVGITDHLGFDNTYVLGMARRRARELGLDSISRLARYPDLRFGFSSEFMARSDGWPGLKDRYGLPHADVRGLDHDLAYRGLADGSLDVIDLYATDAEIAYYDLLPLRDDRRYFPEYHAVILYREEALAGSPDIAGVLRSLAGSIDREHMANMNAAVKIDGRPDDQVAAEFVQARFGIAATPVQPAVSRAFWRNSRDHLVLVALSLSAAILVSVPLGIAAARKPRFGRLVLGCAGVIQTIPSLALLVFMIPLLGIGAPPAVAALFLYSLLPIIRNTCAGLQDIPAPVIESAMALGLPPATRLWRIELPLALRPILAGIKISAVINVGTATLGALIGAGGYGQPILTGIRLNDTGLILQGAVPAALLALLVQGLFEWIERAVMPRGLRQGTSG